MHGPLDAAAETGSPSTSGDVAESTKPQASAGVASFGMNVLNRAAAEQETAEMKTGNIPETQQTIN